MINPDQIFTNWQDKTIQVAGSETPFWGYVSNEEFTPSTFAIVTERLQKVHLLAGVGPKLVDLYARAGNDELTVVSTDHTLTNLYHLTIIAWIEEMNPDWFLNAEERWRFVETYYDSLDALKDFPAFQQLYQFSTKFMMDYLTRTGQTKFLPAILPTLENDMARIVRCICHCVYRKNQLDYMSDPILRGQVMYGLQAGAFQFLPLDMIKHYATFAELLDAIGMSTFIYLSNLYDRTNRLAEDLSLEEFILSIFQRDYIQDILLTKINNDTTPHNWQGHPDAEQLENNFPIILDLLSKQES